MPASRDRSLLKTMNCRKGKWGQIAHWVFALYVAYLLLSSSTVTVLAVGFPPWRREVLGAAIPVVDARLLIAA